MKVTGVCVVCGELNEVTQVRFRRISSFLVFSQSSVESGLMCAGCAEKRCAAAEKHNGTYGWWSGHGMVGTLAAAAANRKELKRALRELSELVVEGDGEMEADRSSLERLPWAGMLGTRASGNAALSVAAIVGIFSAIGLAMCLLFFAATLNPGEATPAQVAVGRMRGAAIALVLAPTVAICGWLEWRRRRTPDRAVDLLAVILPVDAVLQVGRAHLSVLACGAGEEVGLLVAAQNRFDTPTTLTLVLRNGTVNVPVEMELEGSETALLLGSTLCTCSSDGVAHFSVTSASTSGRGGQLVRQRNHAALSSADRSMLVAGGMALGGHIRLPGAEPRAGAWALSSASGQFRVAAPADTSGLFAPAWTRVRAWSVEEPLPLEFAASVVGKFLKGQQADV